MTRFTSEIAFSWTSHHTMTPCRSTCAHEVTLSAHVEENRMYGSHVHMPKNPATQA